MAAGGSRRFTVEILGDSKGARKAIKDTDNALGKLSITGRAAAGGLRIAATGLKGLAVAATATAVIGAGALIGFGKSVVQVGTQYQDSLNSMQAVTHATGAEMAKVAQTSRDLGNDLTLPATSAADAANAMVELAKGNLTADQAMQAAKGTLQLAAAAQIDGAQAATIQADALNAFGIKASQAGHVADVLANAANAATGEISDFALGMQASSAVAHQFGISLDDTVTSLALFANAGIKGSDAGTSLKTALIALAHPSAQAAGAFKKLGVHAFDAKGNFVGLAALSEQLATAQGHMSKQAFAAAAATAFGSDAVRAAAVFANAGADGFDKMAAAIGRQGGAAEVAKARTKGLGGAIAGFQSQVETFKIDVFTKEAPHLEAFIRLLSDKLPDAADAALRGLDGLTGWVQSELPAARAAAQKFGPVIEQWVAGKLELAGHAAEKVAAPALRGIGNILRELAPQAAGAGQAVDGVFRSAIDAAGKVARQFEAQSGGIGHSLGEVAREAGHVGQEALPVLSGALSATGAAAGAAVQSVAGILSILAPLTDEALITAASVKGISLAIAGVKGTQSTLGKVTDAFTRLGERAGNVAQIVTTNMSAALGKDLYAAAGAGQRAAERTKSAFTALGQAAPFLGVGLLAIGYALEENQRRFQAITQVSIELNNQLRLGGQAAITAAGSLRSMSSAANQLQSAGGVAAVIGDRVAGAMQRGAAASQQQYQALSEQDKQSLRVTQTQNDLALAIERYGSTSQEAADAEGRYRSALADQKLLQDALSDATNRSKQSLADYTDQVLYASDTQTALASQELSVKEASLSLVSAQAAATEAVKEHGKGSLEAQQASAAYQRAQLTLEAQIKSAALAAKDAAIAHDKSGTAAGRAAAGANAEREELKKLATTLAPNSPLRKRIQELIDKLNAIPRDIRVGIAVHRTGSIDVGVGGLAFHARASGGPVKRGQPYVVGDAGRPELFVPDQNGMVMPRVPATTSGATVAGPQRVIFEFRSGGSSLEDLLMEVMRRGIRVRGGNVQVVLGGR